MNINSLLVIIISTNMVILKYNPNVFEVIVVCLQLAIKTIGLIGAIL